MMTIKGRNITFGVTIAPDLFVCDVTPLDYGHMLLTVADSNGDVSQTTVPGGRDVQLIA